MTTGTTTGALATVTTRASSATSLALAATIELRTDLATCAATTVPMAPPAANFTAAALVAEISAAGGIMWQDPASSGIADIADVTLTPRRINRVRRSSRARDRR